MIIHIKDSKCNKNRVVMSPKTVLEELLTSFIKYKPAKFLFDGQSGSLYSAKSVQVIINDMDSKARIKNK